MARMRVGARKQGRTRRVLGASLAAMLVAPLLLLSAGPAQAAGEVLPDAGPTAGGTVVTVQAPGAGFTQVSTGDDHSLAVAGDGSVWAWGGNDWGQIGNGTTTRVTTPVRLTFPAGTVIVQVS